MFKTGQIVKTNVLDMNNNQVTIECDFEEYLTEKKYHGSTVLDCVITAEGVRQLADTRELFA